MPGRLGDPEPPCTGATKVGNPDADTQSIRYWVTTTKVEHVNIAAKIKQGTGDEVDTSGSTNGIDSHVTLTSDAPLRLTINDVEVSEGQIFVQEGFIKNPGGYDIMWVHHDWYITGKRYELRKSLPHGHCTGTSDCGGMNDPGQEYAYLWDFAGPQSIVWTYYSWPMGPQQDREVGLINRGLGLTTQINKRRDAHTISVIEYWHHAEKFGPRWENSGRWFQVWDRYGNSGGFQQSVDDRVRWQLTLKEYQ